MGRLFGFVAVILVTIGLTWTAIGSDDPEATDEGPVRAEPTSSAVSPTPTPLPTPTPGPPPREKFLLVFTGEVLSHTPVIARARANAPGADQYDYEPMFAELAPLLMAADLAVCHLETPVSSDNVGLTGYPVFRAPRELPTGLAAAGYDGCSAASNHSLDALASGVQSTLNQMEAAGLGWAGMARSAEEKATPRLYEVDGLTIGHLSYTYGLNGYSMPAGQPYLVNVIAMDAILAEAAAAKEAGAEFVVVSVQWGNEYVANPSSTQIEQAQVLLGSPDIDLIIGAHVHVVQPIDKVGDKYVVYGLGNSLSNQGSHCCDLLPETQNGVAVVVEIGGNDAQGYSVTDLSFVPTRVDRSDYTVVPLPIALADPELSAATRALYESVVAETSEVVNRLGAGLEITDLAALGLIE
jgi:hypothetical protein